MKNLVELRVKEIEIVSGGGRKRSQSTGVIGFGGKDGIEGVTIVSGEKIKKWLLKDPLPVWSPVKRSPGRSHCGTIFLVFTLGVLVGGAVVYYARDYIKGFFVSDDE